MKKFDKLILKIMEVLLYMVIAIVFLGEAKNTYAMSDSNTYYIDYVEGSFNATIDSSRNLTVSSKFLGSGIEEVYANFYQENNSNFCMKVDLKKTTTANLYKSTVKIDQEAPSCKWTLKNIIVVFNSYGKSQQACFYPENHYMQNCSFATKSSKDIIISKDTEVHNATFNSDVYIKKDAKVTMFNTTVNGNIYVEGALTISNVKANAIYANECDDVNANKLNFLGKYENDLRYILNSFGNDEYISVYYALKYADFAKYKYDPSLDPNGWATGLPDKKYARYMPQKNFESLLKKYSYISDARIAEIRKLASKEDGIQFLTDKLVYKEGKGYALCLLGFVGGVDSGSIFRDVRYNSSTKEYTVYCSNVTVTLPWFDYAYDTSKKEYVDYIWRDTVTDTINEGKKITGTVSNGIFKIKSIERFEKSKMPSIRKTTKNGKIVAYGYNNTKIITDSPKKIDKVDIKNGSKGVILSWTTNTKATGYYVYRSTDAITYTKVSDITKGTIGTYTDSSAKSGKVYYYKIVAYTSKDKSVKMSACSPVKTIYRVPATGVASLNNASNGIIIKWNKNEYASGYKIYRSVNGGAFSLIKKITSNATLAYRDTTATVNGAKYQYKIITYRMVGKTAYYSTSSLAKTKYWLSAPTVTATNSAAGKVTVKWNKNDKASGYKIKYTVGTTTKTVKVTSAATVSKVLSSLTKGKTYSISVQSYKMVGKTPYYSVWSKAKSVLI